MADRTGLSYRKETGIVGSVLQDSKSVDGSPLDIGQFVLNRKSAHKARQKNRVAQHKKFMRISNHPNIQLFTGMKIFARRFLDRNLVKDILPCLCLAQTMRRVFWLA